MNGKIAKKIRKEARKRDVRLLPELKLFLNELPFFQRLKVAGRVIIARF